MRKILITIFLFLLSTLAFADISTNIFSDYEPSARARGMGNAAIATGIDPSIIFYNPAGLDIAKAGVNASYAKLFGQEFEVLKTAAFSYHLPKYGTIGIGMQALDVEYQDVSLQSEATFSLAHSFLLIGDVHSQWYLGYGLTLNYLSFGESVGGVDMGEESVFGLDIGALTILYDRIKVAFAVKNINNPSVGDDRTYDLSRFFTIGVAYQPYDQVITELNLKQKFSEETKVSFGVEYELIDNFWLRTGASTYPNSISFGLGLLVKGIRFDYGVKTHAVLDLTHHISLGYEF
jgi:long-subunit fatty acid transport protein